MLKILAGDARGRTLRTLPKHSHVRPILARIKKSVFDIIRPRLPGSNFLDLYAGTGSVGIEALSRGAKVCTFVENDAQSLKFLKENLDLLKFADKATIYRLDVTGNLAALPKPFDLIFIGPPYVDLEKKPLALTVPTLMNIEKFNLLAPKGLVIAQHQKKEPMEFPSGQLKQSRQERYGDSLVTFFQFPS